MNNHGYYISKWLGGVEERTIRCDDMGWTGWIVQGKLEVFHGLI